jgi:O-antigen/teichoic acid export membrane protein
MLKRTISGSIFYQLLLVAINTISSILVTRDLSIIDKSSQAYINILCGVGIIVLNQNAIEMRLMGLPSVKYAGVSWQTIVFIAIGMFLLAELRADYSTWVLTAFYFSIALINSSQLNEFYVLNGNLATQKVRLFYSSILLALLVFAHIVHLITLTSWILSFLVAEISLCFFLKSVRNIRVKFSSPRLSELFHFKHALQSKNLAAILANLIETLFVLILGILSEPEMIAYLSISLAIISVLTIPYVALQAPIISKSDVLFVKVSRNYFFYPGLCFFVFLVIVQFTLINFYSSLVEFVFGPSYNALAENAHLIVIAGLCSLLSRTLNSIFRGMGKFHISLLATSSPVLVVIPLLILNLDTIHETYVAALSLTALPLAVLLISLKFKSVR